jgi:cob(I)alamin adenosyltransferase
MSNKRISSAYLEGKDSYKSPPGFSELFQGQFVSKGGDECLVHSLTEQVRNELGNIIYSNKKNSFLNEDCLNLMYWVSNNIFSYASFCFLCGNTTDHVFKEEALLGLEKLLTTLKSSVSEKSTNFVTYDQKFCLLIDKLRITVRSLESAYWRWSEDPRVLGHIREHMRIDPQGSLLKHQNIVRMGNILNRLSSCLFWINRVVYEENFDSISKVEWSGKITNVGN